MKFKHDFSKYAISITECINEYTAKLLNNGHFGATKFAHNFEMSVTQRWKHTNLYVLGIEKAFTK